MNKEEFKLSVSGPYQPVEWNNDGYRYLPPVATVETVIEVAKIYLGVMKWREHNKMMAKSMHHTAVMMGEVDEPSESETYKPLGYAGFFAIYFTMEMLDIHSPRRLKRLSDNEKTSAIAVVVQLLFALANDDDALAQYARYTRTGYLGEPAQVDIDAIELCRSFVRKLSRRGEQIEELLIAEQYDIPVQSRLYGYDSKAQRHYWSDPIQLPQIISVDDEY